MTSQASFRTIRNPMATRNVDHQFKNIAQFVTRHTHRFTLSCASEFLCLCLFLNNVSYACGRVPAAWLCLHVCASIRVCMSVCMFIHRAVCVRTGPQCAAVTLWLYARWSERWSGGWRHRRIMCPLPSNAPEETLDSKWGLSLYSATESGKGQLKESKL